MYRTYIKVRTVCIDMNVRIYVRMRNTLPQFFSTVFIGIHIIYIMKFLSSSTVPVLPYRKILRCTCNELKIRSFFDAIEFFLFVLWKRFMNSFYNLFYLFHSKSTTLFSGTNGKGPN